MLAAEALFAVTGLDPSPLTVADGVAARALPKEWRARIGAFLDAGDEPFARFRMYDIPDVEALREKLTEQIDMATGGDLIGDLRDPDLATAYLEVLRGARTYLRDAMPAMMLTTPTGPEILPASTVATAAAAAKWAVIDHADRLLDELDMGTLTGEQVEAFKAVMPELYAAVLATVDTEITARKLRKKSFKVPWPRERVLRVLFEKPPEMDLVSTDDGSENAKASLGARKLDIDFSKGTTPTQDLADKRVTGP